MNERAAALADELVAAGTITSPAVEAAVRAVPRHVFVPESAPDEAYSATDAVVTLRDGAGRPTSSLSAAGMQAAMLEQAALEPGMNVLEIGSGGCNAAMLAEVVGPTGRVTSVDIDPAVTDRAARFLAEAGYPRVRLGLGDAEAGWPADAPYDRIIVTVRAWDVPPAWRTQLVDGGVLVVPLEVRGLTRSLALRRHGDVLAAESALVCGFVPMQGLGAHAEQLLRLRGGEVLVRTAEPPFPAAAPTAALLTAPRLEVSSGVTADRTERFDDVPMWLAARFDGFATVYVDSERSTGLVDVASPAGAPAVVTDAALAHLCVPVDPDAEIAVHAFGPARAELAAAVVAALQEWARTRPGPPWITVHPADAPIDPPATGSLVAKVHTVVRVEWPAVPG